MDGGPKRQDAMELAEPHAVVAISKTFYTRYGKRAMDVALAGSLCIVLLPILITIAIAIRLSGRGSVLFTQTRHGLGQRAFKIYKFRTMTVSEDGTAFRQAVHNDHRVTSVGAVLRRMSLDELPQLINVLNGTMSIIGPRPHATAHDDEFIPLIPDYVGRFAVRPGITGLAQIRGLRGPTETTGAMAARVASDIEYASNVTWVNDIKILLATARVVFGDRNAF